MTGLYLHVPFCRRKCPYCHFFVLRDDQRQRERYMTAVQIELQRVLSRAEPRSIETLYLGGGTPALLTPEELDLLLKPILAHSQPREITLEANPEELNPANLEAWRALGINRLSIGVQSLNEDLLKTLGRTHTAVQAQEGVRLAAQAGFDNITIDLMYDLPGQTLSHWRQTLNLAVELPIQHLSLYNLTFEPGAAFFRKQSRLLPLLPQAEDSTAMYQQAVETLESAGLMQYEISAFARPGRESAHNRGYWLGRPYFGVGPSAHSFIAGKRFKNVSALPQYCQALMEGRSAVDEVDELEPAARLKELLAIGLRVREGIDLDQFQEQFGMLEPSTLETLDTLCSWELLSKTAARYQLTARGRLFYDSVATELI